MDYSLIFVQNHQESNALHFNIDAIYIKLQDYSLRIQLDLHIDIMYAINEKPLVLSAYELKSS